MRGAKVTTSRRPFGATTLLTGIEIEPPDRRTVPVTGRSATVVPTGDVGVVAPEASAAAAVAAAIVDPLAVEGVVPGVVGVVVVTPVEGVVAVVVGVVVVTPVVVVSVGNDTVGRL